MNARVAALVRDRGRILSWRGEPVWVLRIHKHQVLVRVLRTDERLPVHPDDLDAEVSSPRPGAGASRIIPGAAD